MAQRMPRQELEYGTRRGTQETIPQTSQSMEARVYMWKAVYNAYKLEEYWEKISGYKQRSMCPICKVMENMEHILTQCTASGQETIWNLAKLLCKVRGIKWKELSLGLALGCSLAAPRHSNPRQSSTPINCMYRITMSELAHLIWKLRCEWKIGREADPEKVGMKEEIKNRWTATLYRRIKIDCLASDGRQYRKKAIEETLVKKTLINIIADERRMCQAWKSASRVLVGMGIARPPGHNK